jgi:hypothetical protein
MRGAKKWPISNLFFNKNKSSIMKRNIISSFMGIAIALLICITVQGQISIGSTQSSEMMNSTKPLSINVPGNALTDSKWYEASYGFVAKFSSNQIHYRVDFDKNGNWLSTIRTYHETKLPTDTKSLVKNSYPGYAITMVEEIQMPAGSITYIIHLEGSTYLINLRICENEMDEWQKISKSKQETSFTSKR